MSLPAVEDVTTFGQRLRDEADRTGRTQRAPMSWKNYLLLPEDGRGEYWGGELVMSPVAGLRHQRISRRLQRVLEDAVPAGYEVLATYGWRPPGMETGEFIPDLMVVEEIEATDETRYTDIPALAVEILTTNRGDDLVEKASAYAHYGLGDYWIVDPRDAMLLTYRLGDVGIYVNSGSYTAGTVALAVAGGPVAIDVDELLR